MMNASIIKRTICLYRFFLIVITMLGVVLMLNGCTGGLKLTSDWQQREMVIDGSDAQWQRGLYYDKELIWCTACGTMKNISTFL
jgi:hypothetical protein